MEMSQNTGDVSQPFQLSTPRTISVICANTSAFHGNTFQSFHANWLPPPKKRQLYMSYLPPESTIHQPNQSSSSLHATIPPAEPANQPSKQINPHPMSSPGPVSSVSTPSYPTDSFHPIRVAVNGESFAVTYGPTRRRIEEGTEGFNVHLKKNGYPCLECGRSYANVQNLERHKQLHLSSEYQNTCHICKRMYLTEKALAAHMLRHANPYTCKECGKTFIKRWILDVHLRIHSGEKPYTCTFCGKSFSDRSNVRAHVRTHYHS